MLAITVIIHELGFSISHSTSPFCHGGSHLESLVFTKPFSDKSIAACLNMCVVRNIYIYNIYIIYIISIIYIIYIIYNIYILYIYTLQYSEAYWTLVLYPLSCIQYLAKGTAFESMLFVNSSLYTYAMLIKYLTCYKFVWHDGHDWISPGWVLRVRNWFINPSNCIPSYPCSNPIHIPGATTRFFLESACHRACTPCRVITVTTQTQGIPVFQDIKDALMRLRKRSMISSDWLEVRNRSSEILMRTWCSEVSKYHSMKLIMVRKKLTSMDGQLRNSHASIIFNVIEWANITSSIENFEVVSSFQVSSFLIIRAVPWISKLCREKTSRRTSG